MKLLAVVMTSMYLHNILACSSQILINQFVGAYNDNNDTCL